MVVELRRHGDKQIHITTIVVLIASDRTKHTHRSNPKPLLQFAPMRSNGIDILTSSPHTFPYLPTKVQKSLQPSKQNHKKTPDFSGIKIHIKRHETHKLFIH